MCVGGDEQTEGREAQKVLFSTWLGGTGFSLREVLCCMAQTNTAFNRIGQVAINALRVLFGDRLLIGNRREGAAHQRRLHVRRRLRPLHLPSIAAPSPTSSCCFRRSCWSRDSQRTLLRSFIRQIDFFTWRRSSSKRFRFCDGSRSRLTARIWELELRTADSHFGVVYDVRLGQGREERGRPCFSSVIEGSTRLQRRFFFI